MKVEVAYATPQEQLILSVESSEAITAEMAIRQSGILQRFPEIDLEKSQVGIFGKSCKLEQALKAGDRVEIYRPLIADPKESRRHRAAKP
ncbi:MAG: RnfH family protein [Methylococcaceae bacterium]|nr:RnfH family protein [Methylococcaceae bacterium]